MNKKLILVLTDVESGNVVISKDPASSQDVLAALQFLDETNELRCNVVKCDENGNTI